VEVTREKGTEKPSPQNLPTSSALRRLLLRPSGYCTPQSSGSPNCPKSDVPMVQRTATKGQNAGKQFAGYPNFPLCREIVRIEKVGGESCFKVRNKTIVFKNLVAEEAQGTPVGTPAASSI
jgi:hypothetical protein